MAVRVLIMGAAGRDFHNFNVCFRDRPEYRVVAFTATQIPGIEGRRYPASLAGSLYPDGIPIYPEEQLESLLGEVDEVIFAYSDVSHEYVMHQACRAMAGKADFRLLGPGKTCLKSRLPVIAVCAGRTGSGKSQTVRRVVELLKAQGRRTAVIRHPMPYGDLAAQAVQRFGSFEELHAHGCTIEEWEEYAPHLERGATVFAGVDYGAILARAEAEAEVILWDGGNNDFPFLVPDLHITVVDPHRAGHELTYFPGEVNVLAADLLIINKVDSAPPEAVQAMRASLTRANPRAALVEAASPIRVDDPEKVKGRRVLVLEDGPTLTHGGMTFGAGYLAAKQFGAAEIVDPRPAAVGSLVQVFAAHPKLGPVLPAMGYGAKQCEELAQTIAASGAEVVVAGTPIDLSRVIQLDRPMVRVYYDLEERGRDLEERVLAVAPRK